MLELKSFHVNIRGPKPKDKGSEQPTYHKCSVSSQYLVQKVFDVSYVIFIPLFYYTFHWCVQKNYSLL